MLQLRHDVLVGFDVQADVVGFGQLVDHVSQLTAAPIFNTVNGTTTRGDHAFVTLEHGRHLLALIRMDQQNDFVMTHRHSLWMKLLAASVAMQQGENP